jgi:hypothetical protein
MCPSSFFSFSNNNLLLRALPAERLIIFPMESQVKETMILPGDELELEQNGGRKEKVTSTDGSITWGGVTIRKFG